MSTTFRLLLALVAGFAFSLVSTPAEAKGKAKWATVHRWVDGDTVWTSLGTVRLVGMDTPEFGECGHGQAWREAMALAPANTQVLLQRPKKVAKRDSRGRLLRYVVSNGVDVGLAQIQRGAAARYDAKDGFAKHPLQKQYRQADATAPNYCTSPFDTATAAGSFRPINPVDCPAEAPIKGNLNSMIFHVPGGAYYASTHPEECFATEPAAQAAGYRKAQV